MITAKFIIVIQIPVSQGTYILLLILILGLKDVYFKITCLHSLVNYLDDLMTKCIHNMVNTQQTQHVMYMILYFLYFFFSDTEWESTLTFIYNLKDQIQVY